MGSAGYAFGQRGATNDIWARVALGLHLEDTLRSVRPYAAFRLVHIHYASADTWEKHPLDSILGSSSEGLQHRSGIAWAGGVSWPVPRTHERMRAMVEAQVTWVPIGNPPAWFESTEMGVGYAF